MTVSLFIDVACKTGESPVYDAKTKRFYFVDIPGKLLFSYDLTTEALKPYHSPSKKNCVPHMKFIKPKTSWTTLVKVCVCSSGRPLWLMRTALLVPSQKFSTPPYWPYFASIISINQPAFGNLNRTTCRPWHEYRDGCACTKAAGAT